MKMVVCSVYDAVAGTFSPPQCFRANGEALRSFRDAVNDEKSQFARHASDYSFYKIGVFDDGTGEFFPDKDKLCEASSLVNAA